MRLIWAILRGQAQERRPGACDGLGWVCSVSMAQVGLAALWERLGRGVWSNDAT